MNKLLLLFTVFSFGFSALSQDITIQGFVSNEKNETLPFVSVSVKGTNNGVRTDFDGNYSITVRDTAGLTLAYYFNGYVKQEILVGDQRNINVVLVSEIQDIDEIVVVGYGEVKTKELTGATSKVKGEDIEKMNLARMDQALQGQVSGVNISTNSGSPGGASNIRIRGLSTFGDNDPLILVDGVVYDSEGLNALNPSDIKSINVLKDATAGIYGVRAANGVIIVETNWQDSIFVSSPVQSHNFSMTGGTEHTKYSIGLGYFTQDGIVGGDKSHFSRYNARLNLSTDITSKLKLNSVFLYSNELRNTLPESGIGSVLYNTINAFPNEPIRTPDGNYSYLEEVSDIINPVAQIENQYNWGWADKFVGKEEFVYSFNDHFTFTNRFNYNYAQTKGKVFSPLVWYGDGKYANTAVNADLESPLVEIADSIFLERGASVYEERASGRRFLEQCEFLGIQRATTFGVFTC